MVRVGVDPRVQISATAVLFFLGGAVSGGKRPGYAGLGSRVVSVLDSGAEGPGFKSQTVHTHHASLCSRSSEIRSSPLNACCGNCRPGGK